MDRAAVFVDAGYLFAQGAVLLAGTKKSRSEITLHPTKAIEALSRFVADKSGCALLRIYWYDGAVVGGQLTLEQTEIAELDHVKVRLGFINKFGQQKGVDSLIVTDLVELSRQQVIRDAVLLSGDEDVRIGVQIAQNYGVRVHLLGIKPSRANQSRQLLWEADTTSEWSIDTVSSFMGIKSPDMMRDIGAAPEPGEEILLSCAQFLVGDLSDAEIMTLPIGEAMNWTLPRDQDSQLLTRAARALGRELMVEEKRKLRAQYRRLARERFESLS